MQSRDEPWATGLADLVRGRRINERGGLRVAGPHERFRVLAEVQLAALNWTTGVA